MKDTIYREDAIKAIHNYWKKRLDTLPTKESECGEVYADIQQMDKILEYNKALCNFIEAIPSADRPQGWIPCSERLPKENTEVLMSLEWGIDIGEYRNGDWHSEWINYYDDGDVLAWMPLPEPWKGADDGEDIQSADE